MSGTSGDDPIIVEVLFVFWANLLRLAHGHSLFVDDAARVLVLVGGRVDDLLVLRDLRGVRLQPPPPLPLAQPSRLLLRLHHPPFPFCPVLVLCLNPRQWKNVTNIDVPKPSKQKQKGSFYLWKAVNDVAHDVNSLVVSHLGDHFIQSWILHKNGGASEIVKFRPLGASCTGSGWRERRDRSCRGIEQPVSNYQLETKENKEDQQKFYPLWYKLGGRVSFGPIFWLKLLIFRKPLVDWS